MPRLQSKNLFNFQPQGFIDHDILALEKQMQDNPEAKAVSEKLKSLAEKDDKESVTEFVATMRGMTDAMLGGLGKKVEELLKAGEETIETEIKVPTDHDGKYDVTVHVYTPKKLKGNAKNAAYLYAHGGGAVAATAAVMKPWLDYIAVVGNVVVFNVDYRLAPETKCPNNVKDFYMAIKYVSDNADMLGIDPTKISIGGDSGGGYICLGAEVLLAQNNETDLIKVAFPGIPMVDDYCFSDPAAMTNEERDTAHMMRGVWKCIATDIEKQKEDPLLFPGKASAEILEKFPATIIIEAEFDMFITEATRMAYKLRAAGRLLEFIVIPGSKHGSYTVPMVKCFKTCYDAMKLAFEEYLHK